METPIGYLGLNLRCLRFYSQVILSASDSMPGPGETKETRSNPCLKVLTWQLSEWEQLRSLKTPLTGGDVDQWDFLYPVCKSVQPLKTSLTLLSCHLSCYPVGSLLMCFYLYGGTHIIFPSKFSLIDYSNYSLFIT